MQCCGYDGFDNLNCGCEPETKGNESLFENLNICYNWL